MGQESISRFISHELSELSSIKGELRSALFALVLQMDFTRDDLISAIQSGTMTPEPARTEAKRLRLPPLEGPADLGALYDPARMPFRASRHA